MKITYEEFIEKLKPEIKEDLKNHKEREWLKKLLESFYNEKLDKYQNDVNSKDERLDVWTLCFYDCIKFTESFKNKEYLNAYRLLGSIDRCTGSFGYAIIKMCEDLFYEAQK